MTFSFLLVNYNMAGLVQHVVGNIASRVPQGAAYEILIADNSTDKSKALTAASFPDGVNIRLLSIDNRGFVDALNQLLPLATGAWVMIMHPDVELEEHCLEELQSFLEHHPKAAVVSPDLYYPDGSPNKIRLKFPTVRSEGKRVLNIVSAILTGRRRLQDEVLWDRKDDVTTDTVMSVCMLFRGDALRQASPIDPRLVFYYANDFLSGRVRQAGWTCHYIKSARAIHYERHTPKHLYTAGAADMEYKRSTIAANARMRADFFVFLTSFYPLWKRLLIRKFAFLEDGIQLAAQFKHPKERSPQIHQLLQSIKVDLGGRPAPPPAPEKPA